MTAHEAGTAAQAAFYGYFGTDGSSSVEGLEEQHAPAWEAAAAAGHAALVAENEALRAKVARLDEALDFAETQDDAWTATVDEILRHSGERSNLTDEGRREAAVGYVRNLEAACKAAGVTVEGPGL